MAYIVSKIQNAYPNLSESSIIQRVYSSSYVNFQRRYVYFEVPKAACTTIKWLLHDLEHLPPINSLPGSREVRRDMFIHDRGAVNIPSLLDFPDNIQEEILESEAFFRFTVVRNPFTRVESAWKDKVRLCAPKYEYIYLQLRGALPRPSDLDSLITLEEFTEFLMTLDLSEGDPHWRIQSDHLFFPILNFNHIGKVEDLDKTLESFFGHLSIDRPRAGKMNSTPHQSNYSSTVMENIYKMYRKDFDNVDYQRIMKHCTNADIASFDIVRRSYEGEILERNIVLGQVYAELDRTSAALNDLQKKLAGG